MTFYEQVKEAAEKHAADHWHQSVAKKSYLEGAAFAKTVLELDSMPMREYANKIAQLEGQLGQKDIEIDRYLKTIIRLKSENDDMKLAGTPYWKERDLMNSYVLENTRLGGLVEVSKEEFQDICDIAVETKHYCRYSGIAAEALDKLKEKKDTTK